MAKKKHLPKKSTKPANPADYIPAAVPQIGRIRQVAPPHDLQPVEAFFGRRMHELRADRKLSQSDLAEKAGLHKIYVSELERGFKRPSLETAARVLDALKVTFAEFFQPCGMPYTSPKGERAERGGEGKAGAGPRAAKRQSSKSA